ncbi:MAG: phage major capsid protein [Deltaproteobacteria bacterium]|nr:phage major capsid protein [Deltaproteobacteria bacterium]MBW2053369.1 phage major capsid protein [Deltaproteobacteria bacterium]MBW2141952.1 phage major capsid protein [Deltaproteobacteria bacterium]MBW2323637.1 phage major capsid protein [Deltaproteobacteria bacterium]
MTEVSMEQVETIVAEALKQAGDPGREELKTTVESLLASLKKADRLDFKPGAEDSGAGEADRRDQFKSFGDQLMAVVKTDKPGGEVDRRLTTKAASGLSENVSSDGGFLIQEDFVTDLLSRTYETGAIAARCQRVPISSNSNALKINTVAETSRANGSRWGGVQAFWAGEAEAYTASKPKFRQMRLELGKLTGLCYATEELLDDATALEAVIRLAFSEEFGFKIDDAVINGLGSDHPLGIMNSDCLITVDAETGQEASTVKFENIVKMWSRMWGKSRPNAVWLINQDIEPQLYTMSMTVGQSSVPVYLPTGGLNDSPYSQLLGRPVIPVEYCHNLGNKGDIILADFSQYLLVDKGGVDSARSIHVRFVYDETTFRFTYRVDGQPLWESPLTPQYDGRTLSPFVTLAARSS